MSSHLLKPHRHVRQPLIIYQDASGRPKDGHGWSGAIPTCPTYGHAVEKNELEDEGARAPDRIAARGRLKRFLADLANRGLTIGLDVLQRYVEHKIGIS